MTISELMAIDTGRQEKAASCVVSLENTYHELKKETLADKFKAIFKGKTHLNTYYLIFKFSVMSDTGNAHTVYIRLNPDFDLNDWEDNTVQVYCDCRDFQFRSAYILNQRKALFLTDRIKTALGPALGEAPKTGHKTTLLCKHSFAALSWLIRNYPSIMKTV